MVKLYRDGKECNSDERQLDSMLASGWSTKKVQPAPVEKPVASPKPKAQTKKAKKS